MKLLILQSVPEKKESRYPMSPSPEESHLVSLLLRRWRAVARVLVRLLELRGRPGPGLEGGGGGAGVRRREVPRQLAGLQLHVAAGELVRLLRPARGRHVLHVGVVLLLLVRRVPRRVQLRVRARAGRGGPGVASRAAGTVASLKQIILNIGNIDTPLQEALVVKA